MAKPSDLQKFIHTIVGKLTAVNYSDCYLSLPDKPLPSVQTLREIVYLIREIIFPEYFGELSVNENSIEEHVCANSEKLYYLLLDQIERALIFATTDKHALAETKTLYFIGKIPEIKRLIFTDVKAMYDNDPAAKNFEEIIFCYPSIKTLLNYRIAHELHLLKIPLIPRIITEMAHTETGIDIHPEAVIGEYFSIDHGTGVVIGQTSIIGNHVCLYQGVTLGAKNFVLDEAGNPTDVPRHPILEDNVTVYSNSSILGRITIGKGTVIGGNVWLTHSVPPNSRILQTKAFESTFRDVK